jgi:hypothetical protein
MEEYRFWSIQSGQQVIAMGLLPTTHAPARPFKQLSTGQTPEVCSENAMGLLDGDEAMTWL